MGGGGKHTHTLTWPAVNHWQTQHAFPNSEHVLGQKVKIKKPLEENKKQTHTAAFYPTESVTINSLHSKTTQLLLWEEGLTGGEGKRRGRKRKGECKERVMLGNRRTEKGLRNVQYVHSQENRKTENVESERFYHFMKNIEIDGRDTSQKKGATKGWKNKLKYPEDHLAAN